MIERNTMPANKQAVFRYITIDKCLSRGPSTIKEIKTACDEVMKDIYGHTISIHSVRNDIANMRDRLMFDAPIRVKRNEDNSVSYFYEIPGYSIFTKNNIKH